MSETGEPLASAGAIVRLTKADAGLLADHLLRLDPADRRLRFCGSVAEDSVRRHCDELDFSRASVLGVFIDGALCAAAELIPFAAPRSRCFELAITVEGPCQGLGLGTRLLGAALSLARNRFAESITLSCLTENRRMQHIARKFGAHLAFRHGAVEGQILQPWPNCASLAGEVAMQGQAVLRRLRTPAGQTPAK